MKVGWVIGSVVGLGIVGLLAFEFLLGGNYATPKKHCLSNLKQLSQSLLAYAAANDDQAPPQDWMTHLLPGTIGEDVGSCPLIIEEGKKFGYAMNADIIGPKLSNLDPTTISLFDTEALGPSVIANLAARATRHGPGTNVAIVDGSAKFLRDPQSNIVKP